jgi:hypothetical protein
MTTETDSHDEVFNEERAQLICLANELSMPTHSPDIEREAIKLQHSFNQILIILIKLSHEEFRSSIQGRRGVLCFSPDHSLTKSTSL